MASLDLWLDGPELDESAGWQQEVALDFDRLGSDSEYGQIVHDHVQRSLQWLAKELEEISLRHRPSIFHDH